MVSVNSSGEPGNNRSYGPSFSANGAFVAFESLASNLTEGDANNVSDVFLRDRASGTTLRVSAPPSGDSNGSSYRPSISADGGFVAFCSRSSNLVTDDANDVADAFLWERATGSISRVGVPVAGATASDGCLRVSLSSDAAIVAFAAVTGGSAGVFVHDRVAETTAAIVPEGNGPSGAGGVSISGDGRLVAFDSVATNLIADDSNRSRDVFVHDREAGTTSRVSVRTSGSQLPGDSGSSGVSVSRDGRFVVFGSTARGVVPGDSNGHEDVFRRELTTGQTLIASVNVFGQSANNSSYSPSVSADGLVVAFTSMAANIVAGDGNRQPDVFVRGTEFPAVAGDSSGPEETGAPAEESTAPVQADDDGPAPLVIYGGIAAGVLALLVAASLLLGRRGRA
jgi:Tol biopolymer transport system component